MADQVVKVILKGEDQTGDSFKLVGAKFKGLQTDVSGLAKVMGGAVLAGGAALGAFLYTTAKGAGEAEAAITRVTATLTAMGPAALKNRDAILANSQAAVQLGFDDEAAAEATTRFYQATNDLKKAHELTGLAMDLARAKNLDLATATQLVNQVLGGNGRALKQYQIDLKDSATPLEALGELHDKVKGQAQAFAGTFEGQMLVINESVSNMKDTIGAALLTAIMPFVQQLTAWASNPDVQKKVSEIAKGIGEFAAVALPVAIETIKIFYNILKFVSDILGEIIFRIEQVISALGRMATAIKNSAIVKGVTSTVSGAVSELKFLTGAKADGGPVMAGGSYLVGEKGPEIFSPGTSGMITPNGAGGVTINISGNTLLDSSAGERIAKQIMMALQGQIRV